MNKVRNFGIALLIPILVIVVFLVVSALTKEPQKAHDFAAGTVSGQVINLYDNLGKKNTALIFIDPEIEGSNKVLQKLITKKDELDIVAVSVSSLSEQEQKELLPKEALLLEKLCLTGGSEAIEKYNIGNAPITYFIDKEGYVKDAFVGSIKDESLEKIIKKLA